jgi:Ser/Thr protein kinase RdoA (MazF antagonist)
MKRGQYSSEIWHARSNPSPTTVHYGTELMQWQLAVYSKPTVGLDGRHLLLAQLGAYDREKATLITLLHSLLGWAVARVFAANEKPCAVSGDALAQFTAALRNAEYLEKGVTDWSRQFWPHVWDK